MTKTMKNKGGRPKIVLTDEQIKEIEGLAQDMTIEQMANYFGISESTFKRVKTKNLDVLTSYKKGKAKGIKEATSLLWTNMRAGDTTSILFYLKTQAGWTTEVKKEEKPKLDFLKDKTPLEIIESTLVALAKGEITIQQAQQISNLAITKLNMKNNLSGMDIIDQEQRTEEEIMAKVCAIAKAIDYQEKLNSKK